MVRKECNNHCTSQTSPTTSGIYRNLLCIPILLYKIAHQNPSMICNKSEQTFGVEYISILNPSDDCYGSIYVTSWLHPSTWPWHSKQNQVTINSFLCLQLTYLIALTLQCCQRNVYCYCNEVVSELEGTSRFPKSYDSIWFVDYVHILCFGFDCRWICK